MGGVGQSGCEEARSEEKSASPVFLVMFPVWCVDVRFSIKSRIFATQRRKRKRVRVTFHQIKVELSSVDDVRSLFLKFDRMRIIRVLTTEIQIILLSSDTC